MWLSISCRSNQLLNPNLRMPRAGCKIRASLLAFDRRDDAFWRQRQLTNAHPQGMRYSICNRGCSGSLCGLAGAHRRKLRPVDQLDFNQGYFAELQDRIIFPAETRDAVRVEANLL